MLISGCRICLRTCLPYSMNLYSHSVSKRMPLQGLRTLVLISRTNISQKPSILHGNKLRWCKTYCQWWTFTNNQQIKLHCGVQVKRSLLQKGTTWPVCPIRHGASEASPSSVAPSFVVMKFDQEGNVTTFGKS